MQKIRKSYLYFCFSFLTVISCSSTPPYKSGENEKKTTVKEASMCMSDSTDNLDDNKDANTSIPEGAQIIIKAYPEQKLKYRDNSIAFPDGTSIVFDDGKQKDFVTMLDDSDIQDMFNLKYCTDGIPEYLADAGRSRCDSFFKKMYGNSAAEVQKHLVNVAWFGSNVRFTSVNGANKQLEKVEKEISTRYPELNKYMKSCGTFYWRKVRGANRQSAHSYGIAIDINTAYSDYWLWKNANAPETKHIQYANRIPLEIVRVFEKYGFVWGGRWYHYDTMHFEYRPEINPNK